MEANINNEKCVDHGLWLISNIFECKVAEREYGKEDTLFVIDFVEQEITNPSILI